MNIALLHAHYDPKHLDDVVADMRQMGAPVIKAVRMECYGLWAALEGCHRLRAAQMLGLTPIIDEVEYSDEMFDTGGDAATVSSLVDDANQAMVLEFNL